MEDPLEKAGLFYAFLRNLWMFEKLESRGGISRDPCPAVMILKIKEPNCHTSCEMMFKH